MDAAVAVPQTPEPTDLFGAPEQVVTPPPARRGRKPKVVPVAATAETSGAEDDGAEKPESDQPIEWWLPSFRTQKPARRRKGS